MSDLEGHIVMDMPDGNYALGLFNEGIAASVGILVSRMTHIEERFTSLLAILAGCDQTTARLIFRSLQSDPPRLAIVRSLVARLADQTQQKVYLAAIGEFEKIKGIRNAYIHGFWQTHSQSKRAFLTSDLKTDHPILRGREVERGDIQKVIIRANMLEYELLKLEHPRMEETLLTPDIGDDGDVQGVP